MKFYTVLEAAQYLSERLHKTISVKSMYQMLRSTKHFQHAYNDYPEKPRRGRIWIPQADLDAYIAWKQSRRIRRKEQK
jgi:hypothetical protein